MVSVVGLRDRLGVDGGMNVRRSGIGPGAAGAPDGAPLPYWLGASVSEVKSATEEWPVSVVHAGAGAGSSLGCSSSSARWIPDLSS